MAGYVPLHVHSSFSPAWGLHHPEKLCAAAVDTGISRMALTDRNGLYGIPHFIQCAREAGIAPLIGSEAVTEGHRAVLLVRNQTGYGNLCRLLSDLHCRGDFDLPSAIAQYRDGLCVLTDDAGVLRPLKRVSPEDLFVELSPGHQMHRALALARDSDLPPVATTRALFLHTDDHILHQVLRAIHLNARLSRLAPSDTAAERDLLLAPARIADHFPHCPEALENTALVADRLRSDWKYSGFIFPSFDGMADIQAYKTLRRRALDGAVWRYGRITPELQERFDRELVLIRDKILAVVVALRFAH
jgi:error-prone DNA polymerase